MAFLVFCLSQRSQNIAICHLIKQLKRLSKGLCMCSIIHICFPSSTLACQIIWCVVFVRRVSALFDCNSNGTCLFVCLSVQNIVVMVQPLSRKGSLKDLLYKVQPLLPWEDKYSKRRLGMDPKKIVVIGRQILEAIDYLKKQGIPCHNLHSGNIIMLNDIPKLAGYENFLFGYKSRQRSVIDPFLKQQPKEKRHLDILTVMLFGHLLYEMCSGVEVQEAKPTMSDITNNSTGALQGVLASIFYHPEERIPTLMEVQSHSCFVNVKLHNFKEMREYSPKPFVLSKSMKELLKAITKRKTIRGRKSSKRQMGRKVRSSSELNVTTSSINTQETSLSGPTTTTTAAKATTTKTKQAPTPPTPPPHLQASPQAPPPQAPPQQRPSSSGRGDLLSSIRQGTSLKKAETIDRSGPRI
eukprot:m.75892 g.75892  ORF g.75892 m.75892 type:complete len:411 (-) comp11859_c0_seq4:169-1401(-)